MLYKLTAFCHGGRAGFIFSRGIVFPIMRTLHNYFTQQAESSPDRIALVCGKKRITYEELNTLADTLACTIEQDSIPSRQPIIIFANRSPETLISMLATLKTGRAYVPIDISSPPDRISLLIEDAQPGAILTTRKVSRLLPDTTRHLLFIEDALKPETSLNTPPTSDVGPEDPACIMYTSGTTGRPKGVVIPHRGITRLVFNQTYIQFGRDKVFLQLASLAFDAATFEIWGPLLHGGTCILYPDDELPDPDTLQKLIETENITTAWLTATLFNTLVSTNPECLSGLDEVLTGGEALSVSHIRKALSCLPQTTLINGYGPTENTTFTTCYKIPDKIPSDWTSIPIGTPLNQTSIHIFDDRLQPVEPGKTGELYTGGDGLALEYLNQPELTAKSFIANPAPDTGDPILYRTGDLVRQLPDGNIDYIGRIDNQVKIRGFRIELEEIRLALLTHPEVQDAVLTVHTNRRKIKHIAAYIVFHDASVESDKLRAYLAQSLPDYMLPAFYVRIEEIPLTTNGKLDRSSLPSPVQEENDNYIAPGSATEKKLADLWRKILQVEQISITDNFFDIGGNSLLGIELIAAINKSISLVKKIDAVALYQFPTIQKLAACLTPDSQVGPHVVSPTNRAQHQRSSFNKFKKYKRT